MHKICKGEEWEIVQHALLQILIYAICIFIYICIFIFHLAEKVHSLITLKRYVGAHINVITDIQMYVIFIVHKEQISIFEQQKTQKLNS